MYEYSYNYRISIVILIVFSFILISNLFTENKPYYSNTSENISYKAERNTKMRYKYITGYETVDENLEKKLSGEPLYTLITDNKKIEVFNELEVPEVSEAFKVKKDDIIENNFKVILNSNIDKELYRADVRIILEELRNGKWVEIYHATFMNSDLYWSLDKGPIEFIK